MEAHTIPEAVVMLETAIATALPGFNVSVSINLTSISVETPVKKTEKDNDDNKGLTLDDIRNLLNAYSRAAGKEKAFALVEKFTNGGKNPADIKPEDYPVVLAEMDGYQLNIKDNE